MKLIWREHKRTCQRMEQAANAVDALTEDLSKVELDDKRRWWLLFNPDDQELIAKCMHVVSLCRMDAAMMGRAEGVVEDAEESGVCGAQQVAALHFHEQVQGAEVVPAASVSVAPSAQFR